MTAISRSVVPRLCAEPNKMLDELRNRQVVTPSLWLDAGYIRACEGGPVLDTVLVVITGITNAGEAGMLPHLAKRRTPATADPATTAHGGAFQ